MYALTNPPPPKKKKNKKGEKNALYQTKPNSYYAEPNEVELTFLPPGGAVISNHGGMIKGKGSPVVTNQVVPYKQDQRQHAGLQGDWE